MFALIVNGLVHELFAEDPHLPEPMNVVDVSTVAGIAVGWVAGSNGTFAAPPPAAPPTADKLVEYARSKQASVLLAGITVNVAASGQPAMNVLSDGTNDTRADLALLALFGQQTPAATKAWLDNNGVVTELTGVQFVTLSTLVGNWISATYPALADVIAQIRATPAQITTAAQIDAYAWPTS